MLRPQPWTCELEVRGELKQTTLMHPAIFHHRFCTTGGLHKLDEGVLRMSWYFMPRIAFLFESRC